MDLFKTFFYWFVVGTKKSSSIKLIGFALVGGGWSFYYSDEKVNFGLSMGDGNEILSMIIAIIGLIICIYQVVDDSKKKAIIIQHTGIAEIPTIDIDSARPIWDKVFRASTINIECDRHYQDGVVTYPHSMLHTTASIKGSIENNTRKINPEYLKLYYGGLVQVPFAFFAGSIFDNTKPVEVYDWDRINEKWYRIKKSNTRKIELDIQHPRNTTNNNKLAIEIAISYDINRQNTINAVGNIPILKIKAQTIARDNAQNIESQKHVANEFHKILDKYQSVDEIHIFIAAQNSMVFNLGRQFSARVHPKILVWQYERNNNLKNPWAVNINEGRMHYLDAEENNQ